MSRIHCPWVKVTCVFGIMVASLGSVSLRAQTIPAPTVAPAIIPVNGSQSGITVTVQITDPTVIKTSVALLRLSATGVAVKVDSMTNTGGNTYAALLPVTPAAAGTTTYKVSAQFGPMRKVAVSPGSTLTAVSVDSIEASLPSTPNPNNGEMPLAGTITRAFYSSAFSPADIGDLMVVLLNAGTLTAMAQNVLPAANVGNVAWEIDRNPADTVGAGTPALTGSPGTTVTFTPSLAGSFRVVAYIDENGNGKFDEGEQLRVLPFAAVQTTLQPGAVFNKTINKPIAVQNTIKGYGPQIFEIVGVPSLIAGGAPAMNLQVDFLLQGGGANQNLGVAKITQEMGSVGDVGNLLNDTFMINYPATAANNMAGTGTEAPSGVLPVHAGTLPMVDTGNAAAKDIMLDSPGGRLPFHGTSSQTTVGAGPGGMGTIIRVTARVRPVYTWFKTHPTTMNPWGSTAGANSFREFLTGFSPDFRKNYLALATGDWTVTIAGTPNAAGLWIPGATAGVTPPGNTALNTAGFPKTGQASGIQVLGLSFALNYMVICMPPQAGVNCGLIPGMRTP